jgi:hypothetical protein
MKKAWLKSWTTWVCRPEQRGSGGRIYAKQVVGRREWDPWWGPIKWPVDGLQRSTWDSHQYLDSESDDSGEPWNLGRARPLLQKEGKGHDSGVQRRVEGEKGRCAGVQGHRGGHEKVRTLHLPVSPPTCQQPTLQSTLTRCHRTCMCTECVLRYIYRTTSVPMQHITFVMHLLR